MGSFADVDLQYSIQHAIFMNLADEALPAALREKASRARDGLRDAEQFFTEQVAVCNRDLLPAARDRKMADTYAQTDSAICAAADSLLAELGSIAVELRARLRARGAGLKIDAALEIEARAALRERDILERGPIFLEACRVGDARIIAAVVNAPSFAPLVNAEVIEAGERVRAHAQQPAVVAELQAVERLLAEVETAESGVRRRTGTVRDNLAALGEDAE